MNSRNGDSGNAGGFGPEVMLDTPAFVHPTVRLYGRILVSPGTSFWPYAVVRAEGEEVRIGAHVNIQDHAMIHVGYDVPTAIGDYCSLAHGATVHGAVLGDSTLVGINATVMDGAVVGDNCVIGAQCVVPEGMQVPDNSIVAGVPGKVIRTHNCFIPNRINAALYSRNAEAYVAGNHRAWDGAEYRAWREQVEAEVTAEFQRRWPGETRQSKKSGESGESIQSREFGE